MIPHPASTQHNRTTTQLHSCTVNPESELSVNTKALRIIHLPPHVHPQCHRTLQLAALSVMTATTLSAKLCSSITRLRKSATYWAVFSAGRPSGPRCSPESSDVRKTVPFGPTRRALMMLRLVQSDQASDTRAPPRLLMFLRIGSILSDASLCTCVIHKRTWEESTLLAFDDVRCEAENFWQANAGE